MAQLGTCRKSYRYIDRLYPGNGRFEIRRRRLGSWYGLAGTGLRNRGSAILARVAAARGRAHGSSKYQQDAYRKPTGRGEHRVFEDGPDDRR